MPAKKGFLVTATVHTSVVGETYHVPVKVYSSKEKAKDFILSQRDPSVWKIQSIDMEGF